MLKYQVIQVFLLLLVTLYGSVAKTEVETYVDASSKSPREKNEEEKLVTTNSNHNLFTYLNRKTDDHKNSQQHQIQTPNSVAPINNYFVLGKPTPYGGAIIGPAPVYVPPSSHRDVHREASAVPREPKPVPIPLLLAPPHYQQGQHPQFLPVLFAPSLKEKHVLPQGVPPNMIPVILAPTTNKATQPQYAPIPPQYAPVPPGFQIFIPPHAFPPKLGDFPFDQKQRSLQVPFHHTPIPFIPSPYRSQTDAANHPVLAFPLQFIPGSHYGGGAFISPKVQIPTGKPEKPVMVIPYARHIAPPTSPDYFSPPKFKSPVMYDDDFDLNF